MKTATNLLKQFAKTAALAALAVAALASTAALAGDKDDDELRFDLVRSPALKAFQNFVPNAQGRVRIELSR
jgi:hypothetical protein